MATIKGLWKWKSTISLPSSEIYTAYGSDGQFQDLFTMDEEIEPTDWDLETPTYEYMGANSSIIGVREYDSSSARTVYRSSGGWVTTAASGVVVWKTYDGERFVNWGSTEKTVTDAFYSWFTANADLVPTTYSISYNLSNCSASANNPTTIESGTTVTVKPKVYKRVGYYNDDVKEVSLAFSNNKLSGAISLQGGGSIPIPETDLSSVGYTLPVATGTVLGGVKVSTKQTTQTESVGIGTDNLLYTKPITKVTNVTGTLTNGVLTIEISLDNGSTVSGTVNLSNLPVPTATTSKIGGIKAQTGSSDGQNFPVQVNADGTAFINIPIYNGEVS